MYRTHTCGELRMADINKSVTLAGWVQTIRKFGSITFIDLRDRYGITQLLLNEQLNDQLADQPLGREFVLQAKGTVSERSNKNTNMPTSDIEILVSEFKVLNESAGRGDQYANIKTSISQQPPLLYKIISYIFLPIAALLGLMTLIMFFIALANPVALLPVFMFACVVIYIFCSFVFLQKGMIGGRICKASLREWIKANAYVAICFAVLFLIQSLSALSNPNAIQVLMQEVSTMQQNFPTASTDFFVGIFKGTLYFMLVFSSLLIVHILHTFKLLRIYNSMFQSRQ